MSDWKYEVPVISLERAMRVPKALSEELKNLPSKKMLSEDEAGSRGLPCEG